MKKKNLMSIFLKYAIFLNIFVRLIKDRTFVTVRYFNHRLNLLWVLYIERVYTGCFLSILSFSGHRSKVISYPFCIVLGTKPHTLYIYKKPEHLNCSWSFLMNHHISFPFPQVSDFYYFGKWLSNDKHIDFICEPLEQVNRPTIWKQHFIFS